MKKRIWEVDFFRGIAIILMIIFHLNYDLREYYSINLGLTDTFWTGLQILIGTIFSFLSGTSRSFTRNSLNQGLITLGYGMLLTLITYFVSPEVYIKFGILHFMGISMILYHFMQKIGTKLLLPLGIVVIFLGNIFEKLTITQTFLFPIGLTDAAFASLDYYPLFPWFGVFLIGVFVGRMLYKEKRSIFKFGSEKNGLSFLGRHSLFIYLVHQPLILALLYIASFIVKK